jgi:hypothetical protein
LYTPTGDNVQTKIQKTLRNLHLLRQGLVHRYLYLLEGYYKNNSSAEEKQKSVQNFLSTIVAIIPNHYTKKGFDVTRMINLDSAYMEVQPVTSNVDTLTAALAAAIRADNTNSTPETKEAIAAAREVLRVENDRVQQDTRAHDESSRGCNCICSTGMYAIIASMVGLLGTYVFPYASEGHIALLVDTLSNVTNNAQGDVGQVFETTNPDSCMRPLTDNTNGKRYAAGITRGEIFFYVTSNAMNDPKRRARIRHLSDAWRDEFVDSRVSYALYCNYAGVRFDKEKWDTWGEGEAENAWKTRAPDLRVIEPYLLPSQ